MNEIIQSLLHDFKRITNELVDLQKKYNAMEDHLLQLVLDNENFRYVIEDIQESFEVRLKIPHRCPICQGNSVESDADLCQACNSKGIVWG